MNTTQTFTTSRQQASAAAVALGITLGMLFSINVLATQPAAEAHMATNGSAQSQMACAKVRPQQG